MEFIGLRNRTVPSTLQLWCDLLLGWRLGDDKDIEWSCCLSQHPAASTGRDWSILHTHARTHTHTHTHTHHTLSLSLSSLSLSLSSLSLSLSLSLSSLSLSPLSLSPHLSALRLSLSLSLSHSQRLANILRMSCSAYPNSCSFEHVGIDFLGINK